MTTFDETVESLRTELQECVRAHSPKADSLYHNGGTFIALAATGTATLLPASMSLYARIAAAIATFVIALSRALDFGGRWRWHIQMRSAYRALSDRVNGLYVLDEADRRTAARKIFQDLADLRTRESGIPGAGMRNDA